MQKYSQTRYQPYASSNSKEQTAKVKRDECEGMKSGSSSDFVCVKTGE